MQDADLATGRPETETMPGLFDPFTLKGVVLRNRLGVSPMCQYSAEDGFVTDWHRVHYASLARGGAGLVVVEATAVTPEGRVTPTCLGIWDDSHAQALAPVAASIRGRRRRARPSDCACRPQGLCESALGGR